MSTSDKSKAIDEAIALVSRAERDAVAAVKAINVDIRLATRGALPALLEARREAEAERAEHAAALEALKQRRASLAEPIPA
ncbi:MAG: hypothetical protein KC546_20555 [Anaerolineae bacterium]|nr:hypothetical protein [Anaerolineae bacterium]MCB0014766.1 hypothetical protein [Anaerolineales bacterium]